MVTAGNAPTPTAPMRTIACTLALLSLLYIAAVVGRLEGRAAPFFTQQQAPHHMSTITYSASLPGGGTITHVATQRDGETFEVFAARAAREWAAVKAANGI